MTSDVDGSDDTTLAPDDAFAVLGNETRMEILQTLGAADSPLPFSELRGRVGMLDSGRFNYHLDELVGHFVDRTEDGYELQRAGERVIEAVLSGAVTETPEIEPTLIDQSCQYCGGPVGVRYRDEQVTVFCTECTGIYGDSVGEDDHGHLGTLFLPPAGVEGRAAADLHRAAYIWGGLATMAAVSGVCPRCSAAIDESIDICEDHKVIDGVCESCERRYAVHAEFECTNCIYERSGAFGVALLTNTELVAFLTTHGINPVMPSSQSAIGVVTDYDEEVVSIDPFEARFTFTIDGDALTLTVDDDLSVVDVTRN